MSHDLVKSIAEADFSDPKKDGLKETVLGILNHVKLIDPENPNKTIKTVDGFQHAIRNVPIKNIKLKFPVVVKQPTPPSKGSKVYNLETMLDSVVGATYGEVIKDVFQ